MAAREHRRLSLKNVDSEGDDAFREIGYCRHGLKAAPFVYSLVKINTST